MDAHEPQHCVPAEAWDACVDPSLPAGVVVFWDARGRPWRYPLAEFDVGHPD